MSNGLDREVLLVEYQKTQDSAEHHDQLVGNVTSLWLGSAVLMGFVLNSLTSKHAASHKTVLIMVIVLGMLLNVLVLSWVERALTIKNQKYQRCKDIEKILDMKQHTDVAAANRWQPRAYRLLMVIFLATWVVLLVAVAKL